MLSWLHGGCPARSSKNASKLLLRASNRALADPWDSSGGPVGNTSLMNARQGTFPPKSACFGGWCFGIRRIRSLAPLTDTRDSRKIMALRAGKTYPRILPKGCVPQWAGDVRVKTVARGWRAVRLGCALGAVICSRLRKPWWSAIRVGKGNTTALGTDGAWAPGRNAGRPAAHAPQLRGGRP